MTETTTYSDNELFRLIAEGNEQAFALLMERYWNVLYSQAIAYLKDTFKAQDLVQEVFLVIWKDRQKLSIVEKPQDYLFIIARNKILNETRKRILLPLLESIEEHYLDKPLKPDQMLDGRQASDLLRTAIAKLPPQRRRVFELSRNEELTYEAIAQQLGISRETVKAQMIKALSFLRQEIRNHLSVIFLLYFF